MKNPFIAQSIGFFSLSGVVDEARLERGRQLLDEWHIDARIPRTSGALRYLDGTDEERLANFHSLLADESLEMLVGLRGGFGITRILDRVDWQLMRRRNMPIIGYSDVSALHLAALKHGCCNHIHGPMLLSSMVKPEDDEVAQQAFAESADSLRACLEGNPSPLLPGTSMKVLKSGEVTGAIIPCNLSMLVALLGTPHMPNLKGAILAVEDVGEAAYRIDRMLAQLKSAGLLKSLKGLIFGDFTDCEDSEYLPEIFSEYAQCINGPVASGLPFGHGARTMSIKVGAFVTFAAGKGGEVSLKAAPLNRFEPKMFCCNGETMGYRLLRPLQVENGRKYPLILFLHGAGERGEDNSSHLLHVLPKMAEMSASGELPAFVVAPQCAALKQWVDTPWSLEKHTMPEKMSHQMRLAMALLDEITATLPIDTRRIYIMGISMGGYGTWDAIQRFPERFAAAVPICGGGDVALASRIANVPVWAFHGELDNLVPVSRTKDMISAMKAAGGSPKMSVYADKYHDSWSAASNEPELWRWMLQQRR